MTTSGATSRLDANLTLGAVELTVASLDRSLDYTRAIGSEGPWPRGGQCVGGSARTVIAWRSPAPVRARSGAGRATSRQSSPIR
jgi:hypothetical protein